MANSARIDELRKKFDENPRRYFAPLANEYRKSGDLQQAIFICQEYLPQQPGHMSGHIVYGQALFESSRFDEAQAVFETALSLDPENLIALKHLGDIARQGGDLKAARIWYQRVLEADPRNEEIAQLMISLLAVPEPAPAPAAPVAQTPPEGRAPLSREPLRPTPTMSTTPATSAPPPPAPPDAVDESALIVEKSESEPTPRAVTPVASPAVHESATAPHDAESSKALDGKDFLDLDDFSIGGASNAQPHELHVETSEPDVTPETGFDLGTEEGPFEADPFAIASTQGSEPPKIELATDLRLGLPSDDASTPMDEHRTAESLDGLQTFEPGVIDTLSTTSEPLERDEFFGEVPGASAEAPTAEAESEPAPEPRPESNPDLESEPESVASPPTFVTETMAELYLRQGHLESAVEIYRQLVDQRPTDGLLAERLRDVESRMRDEARAATASAAVPSEAAAPVYGGPTIREFLSGLAARRTPIFAVAVDRAPESSGESPATDVEHGAASEVAPPDSASSAASPAGGSVSGSIDALFGGAAASPSEAAAASTLQEAFATDGPETAPLRGVPAHAASSELSLDHVFKGNAPPPPDNDGFSFDQFFADEMSDTPSSATGESPVASQPADDIAQFNAWLNGLKKT
jgi:tetratricopeptide (TPR) repeat protein